MVEFIERNLHRFAHIRSKQRKRVAEGPAVFHMGKGNQILRPELSGNAEFAVARNGDVKYSRDVAERLAFDHDWVRVDDRDFRCGGASRNAPAWDRYACSRSICRRESGK